MCSPPCHGAPACWRFARRLAPASRLWTSQFRMTQTSVRCIQKRIARKSPDPDTRAKERSRAEATELDRLAKLEDLRRKYSLRVRLSFAGLDAAKPAFDECMANLGTPAKGWSNREIDQLVSQIKRGKAKCTENKRTRATMCDVN